MFASCQHTHTHTEDISLLHPVFRWSPGCDAALSCRQRRRLLPSCSGSLWSRDATALRQPRFPELQEKKKKTHSLKRKTSSAVFLSRHFKRNSEVKC